MRRWKIAVLIISSILVLLLSDYFYFKDVRSRLDGGNISEAFIRNGSLGKILKNNGYLALSKETASTATEGMCANDLGLKGFDYHDSVRLRFFIIVNETSKLHVSIQTKDINNTDQLVHNKTIKLNPRQYYYSFNFRVPIDKPLAFKLTSNSPSGVNIGHIYIDGQFNRTHKIAYRSKIIDAHIQRTINSDNVGSSNSDLKHWQANIMVGKLIPQIDIKLNNGLPKYLFKSTFPGKKHQGYCRYVANMQHPHKRSHQQKGSIPLVKLYVDHERWFGEHGVLNNRVRAYGRAWEVPAKIKVYNQDKYLEQTVGLRFHGGLPARSARKYARGYRIYARGEYGKKTLDSAVFNGYERNLDFKTIVFKNTYHANFFPEFTEFNPFTHALAFDVANEINALVPDHFMVDLYVNDKQQPLFLGLEHLSERTIKNWLGHNNFELFIYRNDNTKQQQEIFQHIIKTIRAKNGKEALLELQKHYNVNNVINSIILNAYVANHDFCQGAEIFTDIDKGLNNVKVTSINWDLDHSFMQERNKKWSIKGDHIIFPMLNTELKDHSNRDCERTLIYSWVYQQSSEFRNLFKQRLYHLLDNELSYININQVLDNYRHIDQHYYQGKHFKAIEDLRKYASRRPAELKKDLDNLMIKN